MTSKTKGATVRSLVAILCSAVLLPGDAVAYISSAAQSAASSPQNESPKIPPDQLDSLVAPIALYPDPLLAQSLAASTYPLEIIQLQQWLEKNKTLKDKALADAVAKESWDPSIQALAALPEVVKRLADDIQWTTDLGNAFLAQQSDVMEAVQRMRKKAQDKGNLKSTEQQKVETQVIENKSVIIVEQANPQVVYVPSYDPVIVYGAPIYPYPPIYYPPPGYYAAGMAISFGIGIAMGAFWGGGWGWGCGWGGNNNVYINNNNNFNRNTNIGNGNRNNIGGRQPPVHVALGWWWPRQPWWSRRCRRRWWSWWGRWSWRCRWGRWGWWSRWSRRGRWSGWRRWSWWRESPVHATSGWRGARQLATQSSTPRRSSLSRPGDCGQVWRQRARRLSCQPAGQRPATGRTAGRQSAEQPRRKSRLQAIGPAALGVGNRTAAEAGRDRIGGRDLSRSGGGNRDAFGGGSSGYDGSTLAPTAVAAPPAWDLEVEVEAGVVAAEAAVGAGRRSRLRKPVTGSTE